MIDELKELWLALEPYHNVCYVLLAILVLVAIYMIFVKKDKRFKAVVTDIIRDMVKDAYNKGIQVEFIVDDIIAKADKKIREKPDKWDGILLYLIHAKWFRNKVIAIIKDKIQDIVDEEPGNTLEEVKEKK